MRNNDGFWGKAAILAATALTSAAVTYLTTRQAQPATANVPPESPKRDPSDDLPNRDMGNSQKLSQPTQKGSDNPPSALDATQQAIQSPVQPQDEGLQTSPSGRSSSPEMLEESQPAAENVPSGNSEQDQLNDRPGRIANSPTLDQPTQKGSDNPPSALDATQQAIQSPVQPQDAGLQTSPSGRSSSPQMLDCFQADAETSPQALLPPHTLDSLHRVGLNSPQKPNHLVFPQNLQEQHPVNLHAEQHLGDRHSDRSSSNGSHSSTATQRAIKRKKRDFAKHANHILIAKFIEKLVGAYEAANESLKDAIAQCDKTRLNKESSTALQVARSEQQILENLNQFQRDATNLKEVLKSLLYADTNPEGFQRVSEYDIYFGETQQLGEVMLTQPTQFTRDTKKNHNLIKINSILLTLWESSDLDDVSKYLEICKNTVNFEVFAKFHEEFAAHIEEGEDYENPSLYGDGEILYAEELLESVDKCEEVKAAFIDLQEDYESGKQLRNSSRRRSLPFNSLARTLSTPPIDEDGVEREDVPANQGSFRGF